MIEQESQPVRVAAIIVAAGTGRRVGGSTPKQYLCLGGAPVLAWTLAAFEFSDVVDEVALVAPKNDLGYVAETIVDEYRFHKVRRIVAGGATRQDSMRAGLAAVEGEDGVVLVHDGVRPFPSARLIEEVSMRAAKDGAALAAMPVTDTVKRGNERREVVETIPRQMLWAAQTPQAFRISLLRRATASAAEEGFEGTDEAMLVERLGLAVGIVEGDADNIKITAPDDLARAEMIAARRGRRW